MAATQTGALLTQAHAQAQANLSRQTMAELLRLWPLLDPDDIDGTEVRWLRATASALQERYRISQELALRYLIGFRGVELGAAAQPFAPGVARLLPADQLVTSLRVTGPATVKRLTGAGLTPQKAADTALTRVLGAGSRLVQAGGRGALERGIQTDTAALGYQRVTRSGACAFCALLAGRGPVYKDARSAGDDGHRYHDHCHCQAEPVYSRSSELPPTSAAYRAAYYEAEGSTLQEKVASMRHILGAR